MHTGATDYCMLSASQPLTYGPITTQARVKRSKARQYEARIHKEDERETLCANTYRPIVGIAR